MRGLEVVVAGLMGALAVELVAVALFTVAGLVYEGRRVLLAKGRREQEAMR